MTNVMNLLGEIVALIMLALVSFVLPKVREYFTVKIGEEETKMIIEQITKFVAAAEQMYKERDPDGTLRKEFVREELSKLGVEYTSEINALIEGCVYELNKKAKTNG